MVTALTVVRQPAMYAADARIITSNQVPVTSSAADAIVSQVQAIATGPTSGGAALRNAGVRTNVANFVVNHVTVKGLGTSQVVDVIVTDPSPQVAQKAARVLAGEVVNTLNKVSQGGLSATLASLDSEIVSLTEQRTALSAQIAQNPQNQQLQAKLAGLDGSFRTSAATAAGCLPRPARRGSPRSSMSLACRRHPNRTAWRRSSAWPGCSASCWASCWLSSLRRSGRRCQVRAG